MKLMMIIVQDQDSYTLVDDLLEEGYRITKLSSTGGFLKSGNTTLLMGVDEERIPKAMEMIENHCKTREINTSYLTMNMPGDSYIPYPIQVTVGGATIFVMDVDQYIRI